MLLFGLSVPIDWCLKFQIVHSVCLNFNFIHIIYGTTPHCRRSTHPPVSSSSSEHTHTRTNHTHTHTQTHGYLYTSTHTFERSSLLPIRPQNFYLCFILFILYQRQQVLLSPLSLVIFFITETFVINEHTESIH